MRNSSRPLRCARGQSANYPAFSIRILEETGASQELVEELGTEQCSIRLPFATITLIKDFVANQKSLPVNQRVFKHLTFSSIAGHILSLHADSYIQKLLSMPVEDEKDEVK